MKYSSIRAFTLIELLVVVTIIGILAGVSIANFNEYRKKALDLSAKVTVNHLLTDYNSALAHFGSNQAIEEANNSVGVGCQAYNLPNRGLNIWTGSCAGRQSYLPTYVHQDNDIAVIFTTDTNSGYIFAGHCKAFPVGERTQGWSYYNGKIVREQFSDDYYCRTS